VAWPENIPTASHIVQHHLEQTVNVSVGFLIGHDTGSILVQQGTLQSVRCTISTQDTVVIAQQVSSVLMLPRDGMIRVRGNQNLDTLNQDGLHLHVSSIEHDLGNYYAGVRYNQVQQAVARLGNLLSEEIPEQLADSVNDFLVVWGDPNSVRSGELRNRLSEVENQLAETYDEYTIDLDIVEFLTGNQSPVYIPPPNQEGGNAPPPLPPVVAPAVQTNIPAWLESQTNNTSGTTNTSSSGEARTVRPGRLYLRVVISVDAEGNPVHLYPMFKHGTFRVNERTRSRRGNTDLPPRDVQNNRLVSRFCVVSGTFPDSLYDERRFSNRLVEAGFTIEQGIGGQSEWHLFTGETNQERFVELLNAIEVLENFSNENGVQFERRNILEQLELHFSEE
jgi:hypothetical protein